MNLMIANIYSYSNDAALGIAVATGVEWGIYRQVGWPTRLVEDIASVKVRFPQG